MIIGIAGRAGSGKSTIADILVRKHGFVCVNLADPLKRICRDVFDFTDEQLWGPSEERNAPDRRYPRTVGAVEFLSRTKHLLEHAWREAVTKEFGEDVARHFLTVRYAAQQLGTEWGRDCFQNAWAYKGIRIATAILSGGWDYSPQRGLHEAPSYRKKPEGVCFGDVRFPNEVDTVHAAGGIVWKTQHGTGLQGAAGQHESERHIDSLAVDAVVPRGPLSEVPYVVAKMLSAMQEEPFQLIVTRKR